MKRFAESQTKRLSVSVLILLLLVLPSFGRLSRESKAMGIHRISPVLQQEVDFLTSNPRFDYAMPVIVQVKRDLFQRTEILRQRRGQSTHNALTAVHSYTAKLTGAQIKKVLASPLVDYLTLDSTIRPTSLGQDERSVSRLPVHPQPVAPLSVQLGTIGVDRTDRSEGEIRVAIFDSGISEHRDLPSARVTLALDFTTDLRVMDTKKGRDGYGHGTHLAGIVGGQGTARSNQRGVDPRIELIDLKVIGDEGWGRTSNLIRAIDWVLANQRRYQIHVANLSLGHPPIESYRVDPLCIAVRKLVAAGITTVVTAGNLGRTKEYPKIWGGISSPGLEPSVITVGAINTNGTATHRDDVATTYSSRGPTIDGLFKPDLSAPGNKIPSTLARWSLLGRNYPERKIDENYIELSGSSMAAAFVTGTAARMLEANRELTPHLVKMILMLTATKMDKPSMLEQGNGLLNAATAVQLAHNLHVQKGVIRRSVSPVWQLRENKQCRLDCEDVWAGGAFAFADRIYYGDLIGDKGAHFWGDGVRWTQYLKGAGHSWSESILGLKDFVWSDNWASSIVWSSVWGRSIIWSDSIMWTDNENILSDSFSQGD